MLKQKDLVQKVIYPFLTQLLFDNVLERQGFIYEDKQDAPRPYADEQGVTNADYYVYFRIEKLTHITRPSIVETSLTSVKSQMIYKFEVKINVLAAEALEIVQTIIAGIQNMEYQGIYWNGISDIIDLSQIEEHKWLQRYEFKIFFTCQDYAIFNFPSFGEAEYTITKEV